ncbi:MAG TPA: hypothetical protein VI979_01405 [archaeon]|nr:hypothetical protein [archaeon]
MEFKEYAGRAGKAALDGAKKYWTVPAAGLASWIGIGVADHLTNGNYAFYTSMVPATMMAFEAARNTEGPYWKKLAAASVAAGFYKLGWENMNQLPLYQAAADMIGHPELNAPFASQGRYMPDMLVSLVLGAVLSSFNSGAKKSREARKNDGRPHENKANKL